MFLSQKHKGQKPIFPYYFTIEEHRVSQSR